ncbi:hypothetical protein Ndes2526B_g05869 [Nannochloris sp. 'desiccata']|nr:hypothetical protein KSW81_007681 [Chlorella desiccata (nom. nud.)]
MPAGRKIVLAVDDSPISQEAVEWASKKLLNPNDEVHLISVLDPGQRPDISTAGESSYLLLENADCKPNPLQLEQRALMLKKYQAAVAANSGSNNVKMTTLVSCVGGSTDLGRHICEYAAENKADLLVMGSRGMGSAQRSIMNLFGLGSVSEFVTRHGENVLVHRRQ